MTVESADKHSREKWNEFVCKHYPPVGGFMQSWEWGLFQGKLGRDVERYFVMDDGRPVAAFTLIQHSLPFGFRYGYAARGPVLGDTHQERFAEVCDAIRSWAKKDLRKFIFLRLEPPLAGEPEGLLARARNLVAPSYYVQPRHNLTIPLDRPEEDILMSFHPSTRSNIRRAEKRGVAVEVRRDVAPNEYRHFTEMMKDTIRRNSGTNAYPSTAYFDALFEMLADPKAAAGLELVAFYGRKDGEPAATHFVFFFGATATYIYGAAYSKHLNSKVTTYLHWAAMLEAKRRGMKHYDLGGIDAKRWPKLTDFKRQFRGKEFSYVGNIDIPLRTFAYRAYNLMRRVLKK